MKMQCPVCGFEKETDRAMMDNIMLEEHFECPEKHYEYHFVTGYTQELIGKEEFIFSYTTPYTKWENVSRWIAIYLERRKLRGRHK
jgi:hypothetical protein